MQYIQLYKLMQFNNTCCCTPNVHYFMHKLLVLRNQMRYLRTRHSRGSAAFATWECHFHCTKTNILVCRSQPPCTIQPKTCKTVSCYLQAPALYERQRLNHLHGCKATHTNAVRVSSLHTLQRQCIHHRTNLKLYREVGGGGCVSTFVWLATPILFLSYVRCWHVA